MAITRGVMYVKSKSKPASVNRVLFIVKSFPIELLKYAVGKKSSNRRRAECQLLAINNRGNAKT